VRAKHSLGATSVSYLRGLRGRFDRWTVCGILLIALVVAVRLALAFPVHKFEMDSDAVNSGICARAVADGQYPVFYAGKRHGALTCYLVAGYAAVFGPSRVALATSGLVSGLGFVLFAWLFVRRTLGRIQGCLALPLLALPATGVLYLTITPIHYPETMLLAALVLWLGSEVFRGRTGWGWLVALGFSAGLALWTNPLTVTVLGPVFLWLLLRRRKLLGRRFWAWAAPSFLLGYSPRLLFILIARDVGVDPFLSPSNPRAVLGNLWYAVTENLGRQLLLNGGPYPAPVNWLGSRPVEAAVVALYAVALLLLFLPGGAAREAPRPQDADAAERGAWLPFSDAQLLFGLIGLAVLGVYALSFGGSLRGWTVRYVLPLYFVLVPAWAAALYALGRRGRAGAVAAVAAALALVGYNAAFYPWPGTAIRGENTRRLATDAKLLGLLRQAQVNVVVGDYWLTYWINFDSGGAIVGLPENRNADVYHVGDQLPATGNRWALLGESPEFLRRWSTLAGITGSITEIEPGLDLLVADPGTTNASARFRHALFHFYLAQDARPVLYLPAEVDFGAICTARHLKLEGWSDCTAAGSWTLGPWAGLVLPLRPTTRTDLMLWADVSAAVDSLRPRLEVDVLAGGRPIAHWVFEHGEAPRERTAIIASADIRPDNTIPLAFRILPSASPPAPGESTERRERGLNVSRLQLLRTYLLPGGKRLVLDPPTREP